MENQKLTVSFVLFFICAIPVVKAQILNAQWTRKIDGQKVEVKIILKPGSIIGSSCYYESADNYLRYSIRGYFNPRTNEVVWWDDELIEENSQGSPQKNKPLLSRAQFDFPGHNRFTLGGKVYKVDDQNVPPREANYNNRDWSSSADEWEFVLENFTVEEGDPVTVDSTDLVTRIKKIIDDQSVKPSRDEPRVISIPKPMPVEIEFTRVDSTITVLPVDSIRPSVTEQKYTSRKKVFVTEIPVAGDSVELHFYDNAEVDGDSISLFLNGRLIFEHIRLTDKAYSIKLSVAELNPSNELIMVAENLGLIPPNTSFMVAIIGDKKYEARLESTEGSSAVIRLVKPTY